MSVSEIEKIAEHTNEIGPQPLWSGYGGKQTRTPDEVRASPLMGLFYTGTVERLQPDVVVEIGTAFGVSGMYLLKGLENNNRGHLYTYEANPGWAAAAEKNLKQIGTRYTLTVGKAEDRIPSLKPQIDLALIDGIHDRKTVSTQLDIILQKATKNATILIDDIDFSEDMKAWWAKIEATMKTSKMGSRLGIITL